ncbi:hypothetical protein [Halobacillus sp. A5]|uniref:hypothetical protein n=1 Tax=Halobacillus sp. A5 TaxID=2880263 RepID=UPI0020A65283|nr:hypothetical protein [Halobacillus sp. A5]MCP3027017.1 hypothetical protein [Halobacillus sp. A5]
MNTSIFFHRIIDEKLFNKIGFTSQPFTAFYKNEDGEEIHMKTEPVEGQVGTQQIVDPRIQWDPAVNNISLNKEMILLNPEFLFGENGIASEEEMLGVAIRWFSRESSQRRVIPLTEFSVRDKGPLSFVADFEIEEGIVRGNVTFETFIYVAKVTTTDYSNRSARDGITLGTLESTNIMLDGDASMFPIVEVNDSSQPLWWVECNFTEPLYDQFAEENVAIVLNMGHKFSKKLLLENGINSSPLFTEIIASGLQIIIERVKESGDWPSILINRNTEPGSIGEAVFYFINTLNWDIGSPESLAKSIREDFDSRFK